MVQQASLKSFFAQTKPASEAEIVTPASKRRKRGSHDEPDVGGAVCAQTVVNLEEDSPEKAAPPPKPLAEPGLLPLPDGKEDWLPVRGNELHGLPPKWSAALASEFRKPYFTKLRSFLVAEACKGARIFPPANEVFAAFGSCDLDAVRVVVIGQDPYHDVGQAHGLAFSVKPGVSPLPPSLRNMLKEACTDPAVQSTAIPPHGCLQHWANQGVFLLNTCLTVRAHQANSHQQQGWEQFTDAVVRVLAERGPRMVFLLWGAPAQKKAACVSAARHAVIKTSHPSPLSAMRPSGGNPAFLGSRCLSRCNEELIRLGRGPAIDWSIPP